MVRTRKLGILQDIGMIFGPWTEVKTFYCVHGPKYMYISGYLNNFADFSRSKTI